MELNFRIISLAINLPLVVVPIAFVVSFFQQSMLLLALSLALFLVSWASLEATMAYSKELTNRVVNRTTFGFSRLFFAQICVYCAPLAVFFGQSLFWIAVIAAIVFVAGYFRMGRIEKQFSPEED